MPQIGLGLALVVWYLWKPLTAGAAELGGELADPGLSLLTTVELMLRNDPNIGLVEARVAVAAGNFLGSRGLFDPIFEASTDRSRDRSPSLAGPSSDTTSLDGSLSYSQRLRSGQILGSALDLGQTEGSPTSNTGTVSFTLRQPLLQGRRRDVVTAEETASELELEASELDVEHRIAERILTVVSQYWVCKAAALDLEILLETEASSRELLETTRRLIEADLTPAAEIVQLEADLVSREANRIAGEQALFEARQDLGRVIGLDAEGIRNLPLPDDPFPRVAPLEIPEPERVRGLLARSHDLRADLRAAEKRREACEVRRIAADDELKHRLDLVLTPSYSGVAEGSGIDDFFRPLYEEVPGVSASFGLRWSWPLFRSEARGASLRAEATVRQSELAAELTSKDIDASVPSALEAVRRSAERLVKISESIEFFERALENEIKKLRGEASTLVDVITQRDRLTAAQQRQVAAELSLARALVDLRFQTGSLLPPGDTAERSVEPERLTSLPF